MTGWNLCLFNCLKGSMNVLQNNTKSYCEYSFINHLLTVFLHISAIKKKCEIDFDKSQFGFKNSLYSGSAIFFKQKPQKYCNQQKDVFLCFIDYKKAFDMVKHDIEHDIVQWWSG